MSLRNKSLLIIGLVVGGLVFIIYLTSRTVLLNNYLQLEQQSTRRGVDRVVDAFNGELSHLGNTAADWATWDDSYDFVHNHNDEYVEINLTDAAFDNLSINLMIFVDATGEIVFEKTYDLQSAQEMPTPAELHDYLLPGRATLNLSVPDSSLSGFVLTEPGVLLIAARPILTSLGEGPTAGTLILGKFLDPAEVERLRNITHQDFIVGTVQDERMSAELSAVTAAEPGLAPVLVQPLDKNIVTGSTVLSDIAGEPAVFIEVELARDIYNQGMATISYFTYLLVIMGLACGVLTILLLDKVILSRVANLNQNVRLHSQNGGLSGRLEVSGNDEISSLGNEINKMLTALEKSEIALRESVRLAERAKAQKALDRSERLYQTLFESANDAILLFNPQGDILTANQQTEQLLGYAVEELVGKGLREVVDPAEVDEVLKGKRALLTGGSLPLHESAFRKKDGTKIPVEINASLVLDGDSSPLLIQSVVRDIGERKSKELQIQRQVKRLNAIRNIEKAITTSLDLRLTLDVLLSQIVEQLDVDAVDILLYNPYTQTLDISSRHGFHTGALRYTHLSLGESYAGQAALEQRIIHIPDLEATPGKLSQAVLLTSEGFKTYYAVPLIAKGQVKGVLEIFHRDVLDPDHEWDEFLESLAAQAAIAIDNALLFRDIQRVNLELSAAYDATLFGWAKALELRDYETEGHSQRVTEMAVRLGQAAGIGDEELVHLRRGALLHDIGKMAIPDHILLKPGPLSEQEWEIMRKHPVYAKNMLSSVAYLRPALEIPYCHHEKWDGTGYPRGLKGDQIPLAARVFSIIDVWDALSSDRPYRKAWPSDKVIAHLREQGGMHFDPQILPLFLELLD